MDTSITIGIYVQLVLSVVVPIGFVIWLRRKQYLSWKALWVGILIFIVFALILERMLHAAVISPDGTSLKWTDNPYLFALYGALAAGLFEEFGRYFGYKVLLKNKRSYGDGLSLGAGHGGIEAILVGAFASVNSLVVANMINAGTFEEVMKKAGLTAEQIEAAKESVMSADMWLFILGGLERVAALILQVALALLVLLAVRKGSFKYLWAAIGFHMLFDIAPGLYQAGILTNIWVAEFFILVFAAIAVVVIRKLKDEF